LGKILSGLFALAWIAIMPMAMAHAGDGTIPYEPGALKAAIAKGDTVLLHYKSTW
jgi:hypothetical protein